MAVQLHTLSLAHLPATTQIHLALFTDVQNTDELQKQLLAGNAAYEYAFVDASLLVSPTHIFAACFRALNDQQHARLRTRNVHSEIVFCLSSTSNISAAFRTFGITPPPGDALAATTAAAAAPASSVLASTHEGGAAKGLLAGTQHVLVVKVSTAENPVSAAAVRAHLAQIVAGTSVGFTDKSLTALTDWERIKRVYKIDIPLAAAQPVVSSPTAKEKGEPAPQQQQQQQTKVRITAKIQLGPKEKREVEAVVVGMMALRGS